MTTDVSMRALITRYAAFLIDVYGVLQHSTGTYPKARAALAEMKRQGKTVFLFSNTADRLPETVAERLNKDGFDISYEQVITSGLALAIAFQQWHLLGKEVIPVGNNETEEYVRRAGATPTLDWHEAEASVIGGYHQTEVNRWALNWAINLTLQREKPAFLANTDRVIPVSATELGIGPGMMGVVYQTATQQDPIPVGKPYSPMYELAYQKLVGVPKSEILVIGDTLDVDIRGAHDQGLDNLLVLSGMQGLITPGSNLDAYMRDRNLYPTYVLPELSL
jgi:HAD superfamily hydrolase (TIGR01459 family)